MPPSTSAGEVAGVPDQDLRRARAVGLLRVQRLDHVVDERRPASSAISRGTGARPLGVEQIPFAGLEVRADGWTVDGLPGGVRLVDADPRG